MTTSLHYGRAGRATSWSGLCVFPMALALLSASCAFAQYPGQIKTDKDKEQPSLRAVAVLEWTGDLSKPKTSRLVPVTLFDGEQLQDAGVYLARPEPLAVAGGVEYILQKNGAKLGLFDIQRSGQEEGSWVGLGVWKPMPKPKAEPAVVEKIEDDENSDRPVLHRKHAARHDGGGDSSGSGSSGPPPDPDRPTLKKSPANEDSTSDDSGQSAGSASGPAPDPDRTTLHKAPDGSQTGSGGTGSSNTGSGKTGSTDAGDAAPSGQSDPDRPQLKRGKAKQQPADEGYVSSVESSDPDRPHLMRGKPADSGPSLTPTLMGLPTDMAQAVAVSDPRNRPEHPWSYSWANLDDEAKMKEAMEDAARAALGIQAPPPAAAPKKTAAARTKAKPAPPPPEPAPLADEQFRVFELAYGAGATMVLTAHTDAPLGQQKYVTLIGQPDLYGSLLVLFKNVADGAHLDDTPRMRLVDAVDALADNRGELLFELRGKTTRQFALYRVLRGTATQLFVTGGGATAIEAQN